MAPIEQLAAEKFAEQMPPMEVMGIFEPLMEVIKPAIGIASAVVGGLFGLYLIFILARLYYERKKVKLMKDIRYDLDYLNQHFELPYSQDKRFKKKVMGLEDFKEMKKAKEKEEKEKEERKSEKRKEKEMRKEEREKNKRKEEKKR